jgi:hypothetical protein
LKGAMRRLPSFIALVHIALHIGRTAVALKLAAIGDFGVDNVNEQSVASMISGWGVNDILALGDNNYCGSINACLASRISPLIDTNFIQTH